MSPPSAWCPPGPAPRASRRCSCSTSRSIRTSRSRPTRSGRTRSGRGSRSHDGRGRPRGRGCGRGIFTDLLAWDAAGRITALKVPTTPEHPAAGVLNGLAAIACRGRQRSAAMNTFRTPARRVRSLAAAALLLACCDQGARPPSDPYDIGKVDLKPTPAKVGSERHKGAFAKGDSLSMGAELKRLDPSPVKTVRLDTAHKIIEIAPGVKFSAWTFGNQVPGPTIRARVGDKIKFSMTNRSDEPVSGVRVTAAPMMHSMDFHAAMVSPQDKYRSIAPGQTIEFEFTANYPGIFMYHCGTPMILEHIASGMYGAVIVEPRAGYPTKVDREYVIVQSEFYAKPDPGKRKADGAPLYVLDGDRLRASQPTYTVFNGVHNGMVKTPLAAKSGERVRLHVLNVGPSKTSSFHVVGTNFESKCLACHSVGEGRKLGPDVAGVTKRRSDVWLTRWLKAPEKMLEADADAKAMLKEFNNLPMPNQSLSDVEIQQYIKYLHWIDARPAGAVKASGAH